MKEALSAEVYFMIKGLISSVREDWSYAEEYFRKSNYRSSDHMGHFLRGHASFRHPLKTMRSQKNKLDYAEVISVTRNDVASFPCSYKSDVFVFSAEPNYFNRFALEILTSSLAQGLTADFLFFIIGDASRCTDTMAQIQDLCTTSGIKCHYMFGHTSYELLPVAATARFLAAYEILNRSLCQVFIFDIDMFITREMGEDIRALSASKKLALSLKTDGARSFPWTNIAAAGTFYPQNQPALFFARAVCEYFLDAISRENNNWWIDQNALFAALKQFKTMYYSEEVINMHSTTGKGLSKNEDDTLIKWKRSVKKV